MAALPYMQFYVAEYLADTAHLDAEENGAYLLLIMHAWRRNQPIPASRLHIIARMQKDDFDRIWTDSIGELFEARQGGVTPISPPYKVASEGRGYSPEFYRNRSALLLKHDGRCFYCNQESEFFEVDHVMPVALGGPDSADNLVVACRACNRSKGAKTLSEWRAS